MDLSKSTDLGHVFARVKERRVDVSGFVNIGAGRGDDTAFFLKFWPQMKTLLIDMDERFVQGWHDIARRYEGVGHVVCAAGANDGIGSFVKSNDVGGALSSDGAEADDAHGTPIKRIDTLVDEFDIPPPYFLKFDTHGVELDILAGAEKTLRQTNLIMMEVYNFKLNFVGGKNLTFDEMSLHMKSLGFRCVDICDPLFRPGDHALWQMHMIFIRDDHETWARNSYSPK